MLLFVIISIVKSFFMNLYPARKAFTSAWLLLTMITLVGQATFAAAAHETQVEAEQPYTFVPAPCTFIDTSVFPFFSQSPEEQGFTCGYVIVPERHANPEGPTMRLPVAILHASELNPRSDPLFVAQGGPGGSAFEIFPYSLPGTDIAAGRDIVMFNQRGSVSASPELLCTETIEGMSELVALPYEEATTLALEQMRACYQRLEAEGLDFSAFNSLENALDVEAIRQALGYESYNFYGVSYGTLLGLHLMRLQPEGLRSVILDGVVPPDINFILHVPQNENRIYDELFRYCVEDPVCREDFPNLEDRFFTLVEDLDETPVTLRLVDADTGEVAQARLDGKALKEFLFQFFYLEHVYALFPRLVSAVEMGDYLTVEKIWSFIAYDRSFSEGMYYSVICAEDADFEPGEALLDGVRPQIAESVRDDLQTYLDACAFWQVDLLPASVDDPVQSDIPTLLLSGQFDPITPPDFAAAAAESLTNAYHVIDPVGSHGVAFSDACMNGVIQDFLNNPGSSPGTSCLESPERWGELVPADAVTLPMLVPLAQLDEDFLLQVGAAGVLLAIVLSAFFIWPLAWLINRIHHVDRELSQKQKRLRLLSRGLVLMFGFVAVIFVVAITSYVVATLFYNPTFLSIYTIPGKARLFLAIPYLLVLLAVGMLAATVFLWRNPEGLTWEKLYYSLLALCAAGYVGVLGFHGFLSIML